jgi:hypothetical protein
MDTIIFIANKRIFINKRENDIKNILLKINEWIEIIILYNDLLKNNIFQEFDTNDKFFTNEMRLASLGTEYYNWNIIASSLHQKGEKYKYEKLAKISNTGLVEWYCNKLNFSKEKYNKICKDSKIILLGVFYHRLKIIIENIRNIFEFFNGKYIYNYFQIKSLNNLLQKTSKYNIYYLCSNIKYYYDNQNILLNKYLILEQTIELSQIVLFNNIKNFT